MVSPRDQQSKDGDGDRDDESNPPPQDQEEVGSQDGDIAMHISAGMHARDQNEQRLRVACVVW